MSEPTLVEIHLDAPIARVTVLEDRAAVSRVAQLPPVRGQLRLVISNVSPLLVDKSLRATSPAGSRVLDVRCRRSLAPWQSGAEAGGEAAPHQDAAALTAAVDRASHEVELARAQAQSARDDLAAHQALRRAELGDLSAAATRGEISREAAAELAARDDDARAYVERIADAALALGERELALRDAQELASRAAQRAGVETARLELDCLSDAGGGELTIEYLVPAAAWRPFHRAHLIEPEGDSGPSGATTEVRWEQGACLWQRTGEDWTGVELALSAERASLGVEPPALEDDLLDVRPKPQLTVSAREQEIEHVGLGEAGPAPGGEPTVMGVDDGGLGLLLRPAGACTVRSDGRPHRVALETFASEAETELLAIPLRSPLCHVRTRFANRASAPILAGPVDLVRRSGFIGRTDIDFVNAQEKGELGFGGEPEVRVHREQHEDQEESSLLGGWTSKVVRVAIRLSNLGTRAREVTVCDRVPVSEIEQVVIHVSGPEAYLLAKERRPGEDDVPQITARAIDPHGIVTWKVPLSPRGRAAVTLEYKVKSKSGVAGL